jgi:hypothetical protein
LDLSFLPTDELEKKNMEIENCSHEQDMAKGIARMQSSRLRTEEGGGPHEL